MASSSRTAGWWGAWLLPLLLNASVASALTEFSADITYYDQNQEVAITGRLYVSDDLIREERQRGAEQEIRITDLFKGSTTVIDPQREEFQQIDQVLILPRNPVRFCAEAPLMVCEYQQREQLNGRETERWGADLGFAGLNIQVTAWYDPKIQYPLRLQLDNGGYLQLSNIEVGRLPSSVFSLPFNARRVAKVQGIEIDYFSVWP